MSASSQEQFSRACGLTGPLELLVTRAGEAGRARRCLFEQPFVLVGRDRRAHLRLEEASVGRRHAYLQVIAGQLFCVDLDSRTGIHWEDGPRQSGWLLPDQAVRIGPFAVRLVCAGGRDGEGAGAAAPDWSPTGTRMLGPPAGPSAVIEFSRGGKAEARCRLTRVLTLVGRSRACRLRLTSPEDVSRYHCALLRTPADVWALDLQGRGGIRVGGAPMTWARLADADRLEVGPFVLRLRCASAVVPVSNRAATAVPRPLAPAAQRDALDPAALGPVLQQMATMQQQMFDQFGQAMTTMLQMFGSLHREQMGMVREELDRLRYLTLELHDLRSELSGHRSGAALPANGAQAAVGRPPREAPVAASDTAATAPPAKGLKPKDGAGATGPAPPADGNIHAWLSQRIAALEEEQQTRWQKLMNVVLGK